MSADKRPRVVILIGFFLPGVKAGGPIRTIANLVQILGDEFAFSVVTRDRDLLSADPYPEIDSSKWISRGRARVMYLPPRHFARSLISLLRSKTIGVLYINSCFEFWFSIFPLVLVRLGLVKVSRIIVAPRGEFAASALKIKSFKKKVFLFLADLFGLHRSVLWHASTSIEFNDIVRAQKIDSNSAQSRIKIASDLVVFDEFLPAEKFFSDGLRICFVSRIVPIKNLIFAIEVLKNLRFPVRFDVYGFQEDFEYWEECRTLSLTLPSNVSFNYLGGLKADEVRLAISRYDVLFVPTKGENFGHIFVEALSAGVPILVSDQTPWRNLTFAGVGWDISLDAPAKFNEALSDLFSNRNAYLGISDKCRAYAAKIATDPVAVDANRSLFEMDA